MDLDAVVRDPHDRVCLSAAGPACKGVRVRDEAVAAGAVGEATRSISSSNGCRTRSMTPPGCRSPASAESFDCVSAVYFAEESLVNNGYLVWTRSHLYVIYTDQDTIVEAALRESLRSVLGEQRPALGSADADHHAIATDSTVVFRLIAGSARGRDRGASRQRHGTSTFTFRSARTAAATATSSPRSAGAKTTRATSTR